MPRLTLLAFVLSFPASACEARSTTTPTPAAPAASSAAAAKPGTNAAASTAAQTPPKETPPKETPPVEKPPVEKPAADKAVESMKEFIAAKTKDKAIDTTQSNWKTKLPLPPKLTFDAARKYSWVLTTSEGPIRVLLNPQVAPMHVSSTIYLTELGFYDGLSFHRVIPGFMAQGGCPLGNGTGSPGYKYAGEFAPNVKHDKPGLLSMANAGPNTDGSQFFLTFVPTPHLDDKHTIFGEVVEGLDTLKKLESFGSKPMGQTKKTLSITKAKIVVE
jgi:cyclophilin family peptidyl-prolyl cis-trans isomerase